jgi:hypothetical protein
MADAFGQTFWWALGLLAVALLASLTLPKRKPQVSSSEEEPVLPMAA